jgi:hypothetical protein
MKTRLLSLPLRKLASWTPWTTLTHDAPTDAVLAHAAPRKNTQKTNAWTRTDPAPSRAFELFVRIIITSSSTRLDPLDPLDPPFFLFSVRFFPRTHAAWHPMLFTEPRVISATTLRVISATTPRPLGDKSSVRNIL